MFVFRSASLMCALVVEEYRLKTVQEYMYHIRANAENSVRSLLVEVAKRVGSNVLTAVDYLDDGTPVSTLFACPLNAFDVGPDPTEG